MPEGINSVRRESKDFPSAETEIRPTDGGWGWMVCFAAFMVNFTVAGMTSTNGTVLLGMRDLFNESIAKTSIVSSVFTGVVMSGGPFVLFLINLKASHRQIMMAGGITATVSSIASYFAPNIETMIITYGILLGISGAINFYAANVILGYYFDKKRALALGIANSGAGCGGFVLSYLTEKSISFYGMRGTLLLIGGLFLNLVVYGTLCRPLKPTKKQIRTTPEITQISEENMAATINPLFVREIESNETQYEEHDDTNQLSTINIETPPNVLQLRRRSVVSQTVWSGFPKLNKCACETKLFKNKRFLLLMMIYFSWSVGDTSLIYLPAYAESLGLSREEGALNVSVFGIFSTLSQIFVGFLADVVHVPTSYLLLATLTSMSLSLICFPFCKTFASLVSNTVLLSIAYGFGTSLRIVMIVGILGIENMSRAYSFITILIGVGYTVYPIVSGILYDATNSFHLIFYMDFAIASLGAFLSCGIVYIQKKEKFAE